MKSLRQILWIGLIPISTERYRMNGIADLRKELARYHPLDRLKGTGEDHR